MADFAAGYYRARDGLMLYCRQYAGDPRRVPVLCLPGLTRNCMDFARLAAHIIPRRSVITPDMRGRGRSQYDVNWLNYHPLTYVDDVWSVLQQLSTPRVVVIGTSLGGLMAMLMTMMRPQSVAAVVLNDVGPELNPSGAQRIYSCVGRLPPVANWEQAVAQMRTIFSAALPDLSPQQWRDFTEASFLVDERGVPQLAADPKIGELLRLVAPGLLPGMWLAFAALRIVPTLALRGALSDLLSSKIFDHMQREHPRMLAVTVPNRGHAPMLDEPESLAAIDDFLDGLDE
jgi:pimeloyl-ACP methyl ester carboxylesterase